MTTQWTILIRNLVKTYLDNYILPGSNAGTEVLWVYMVQWKRHMANITFATIYLLLSQANFNDSEGASPELHNEKQGAV